MIHLDLFYAKGEEEAELARTTFQGVLETSGVEVYSIQLEFNQLKEEVPPLPETRG